MTLNYYLNTNKISIERSIFLYLRENGKTLMINSGIKVKEAEWDKKKQQVKKLQTDLHHSYNRKLDNLKNDITKKYYAILEVNPSISFAEIKLKLLESNNDTLSFFNILDKYINSQKTKVSYSSLKKYNQLKNKLIDFSKTTKFNLELDTIKPLDIDNFGSFLIEKYKLQTNSTVKVQKTLMGFLRWANDNGFTNNFFPFKYQKQYIPDEIALSKEELLSIEKIELESRLDKVRDIFLFQTYTGQRYIDIQNFEKNQIFYTSKKNQVWKIEQLKTGTSVEIPLCNKAILILDKYDYNIPSNSNQKQNAYLKEIGKLIEMNSTEVKTLHYGNQIEKFETQRFENLKTHTARRTFITLCNYEGINSALIDSIAGHGNRTIQHRYIKKDHDKSIEILNKVFG